MLTLLVKGLVNSLDLTPRVPKLHGDTGSAHMEEGYQQAAAGTPPAEAGRV